VEPFVPYEVEYIAWFPVDDDLVPPPPEILVNRDVYDPATQDASSWDSCDEDIPDYMMRQLNLTSNLPPEVAQSKLANERF
jgi:hypothetical protein